MRIEGTHIAQAILDSLPSTQMPRSLAQAPSDGAGLERGFNDRRKANYPNAPTVRSWVLGLRVKTNLLQQSGVIPMRFTDKSDTIAAATCLTK